LNTQTNQIIFSGFIQESKDFIKNELCSYDQPVFLYQMRAFYPRTAGGSASELNYGGYENDSQYEDWNLQKDVLWFNCMNSSTMDKYIILPLSLTQSTDVLGPTFSPALNIEDGQYTYHLRMIPIYEGIIPELTGITGPTTLFPNGTASYSNMSVTGWTQSHYDMREIIRPSYLLEVGRMLVINDPILTKVEAPLGYDKGVWNRKDDDSDVYL